MVNYLTILPFLSKPNEPLHLADISRQLKIPHPTARLHLNKLEKEGILEKSKKGNLTLYKLNFNNPLILHSISVAEKQKILIQNIHLKQIIEQINTNGDVIIFGSILKDFEKARDIDILTTTTLNLNSSKKLHIIKVKSLSDITEALKQEIVKNHLIIQETDRVVKWLYAQNSNGVKNKSK